MIDFDYTAPELLPFRIQEVLDAPNEPHRIGGVVYVPEDGWECENVPDEPQYFQCSKCTKRGNVRKVFDNGKPLAFCPDCRARIRKAVKR